jgi:hypothetical protein
MTTNNAPDFSAGHRTTATASRGNKHAQDPKPTRGTRPSRAARRFSPLLSASAAGMFAVGVVSGLDQALNQSPIRETQVAGTAAWTPHLVLAAAGCAAYGCAVWRRRRAGRRDGRPLLLAPLGATAAARVVTTLRQASWRTAAALPLLGLIAYNFWRCGEQVTAGLDPNFTINAWGGPTYIGAMACHYLDAVLLSAAAAWLLSKILRPAARDQAGG